MADTLTLTDAPGYLGGVSTDGDGWATDERPTSFRQKILQLNPNGMMPLTGITSMGMNEKVDDPQFSWFEKDMPLQGGTAAMHYGEGLGTDYTNQAAAAGAVVTAQVTAAVAAHFRRGQIAGMWAAYDESKLKRGRVMEVIDAGANSQVIIKLLEADASNHLADTDYIGVIGNSNQEGASRPQSVGYKPVKRTNYTQIFRNPYKLTRTAMKTKLRTRDPYQSVRQEQLMLHGLDIERALIWGIPNEDLSGEEPERTSGGIMHFLNSVAPENVVNFRESTDTEFTGQAWDDKGIDFVERYLEHLFQYGSDDKLCVCGTGFLRSLNKLARLHGEIEMRSGATGFGLRIVQWTTPYGTVNFKTHALFSRVETLRWGGLFLEPSNIRIRVIDDTDLKTDREQPDYDGKVEEYLAELGFEIWYPKTFMWWGGVGLDNVN